MPELIEATIGGRKARVLNWASILDEEARTQALHVGSLPFVRPHVALMPDAHKGYGACVGAVVPSEGAIVPYVVGVDIGCGMIAVDTGLLRADLPDEPAALRPLLEDIARVIPAGVGQAHLSDEHAAAAIADYRAFANSQPHVPDFERIGMDPATVAVQFGTLGAGNHFFEVCLDTDDAVWLVVHSGSRGVGGKIAQTHVAVAKDLMRRYFVDLPDPDLAFLVEGTAEFDAYVRDLGWAQGYALANRERMMDNGLAALGRFVSRDLTPGLRINCHHNYAQRERHGGRELWLTRKGAIRAGEGEWGVIPGSMGAKNYITVGKGSRASFCSSSHGAGRVLGRNVAHRTLSVEAFREQMAGRVWQEAHATALLDEAPDAYKDIDRVMEDQRDLTEARHTLRAILNYKGL